MELIERVGPRLQKQDIFWRKALDRGLSLALTLRYMVTGNSYKSLQYGFRVAHNTISVIIPETCEAIFYPGRMDGGSWEMGFHKSTLIARGANWYSCVSALLTTNVHLFACFAERLFKN